MPARLHVPLAWTSGAVFDLPPAAARHVQVLRLQPGDGLMLFNGDGGEWSAEVLAMGRQSVQVRVGEHRAAQREVPWPVTLAVGMPANDRMDFLVEKAGELGAAVLQPLVCERSVLRLQGERAAKKVAHWQAVAVAASEQCGRTEVMEVLPVQSLGAWLAGLPGEVKEGGNGSTGSDRRWMLSLRETQPWRSCHAGGGPVMFLSGPEGGLSASEEALARQSGFAAVSLGPRVLRADTAPLAALACLAMAAEGAAG